MRRSGAGTSVAWLSGTVAAGWALWSLGGMADLGVNWSDPLGWLAQSEIEVASAALLRLAGLMVVAWILTSTVLYMGAVACGMDRRRLQWLSIGPIRRAVDSLLAGYLMVAGVVPAGAAIDPVVVPDTTPPAVSTLDPSYVPVPAGDTQPPARPPTEIDPPAASAPGEEITVVVTSGDHMWKLAERHLTDSLGRPPSLAQIDSYWRRVVEVNRSLIRSGDPDLIFPGEVLVLPEVSRES